jgi:hypothetical protein
MVSALVALDTRRFSGRVATATVDPRPEGGAGPATVARHFADIGWVAVRTAPDDPGRDLFVLFKSSPYGAVSHQHADQNCFVLSAGGEELLVSTGAYDVWDGPHHHGWTRQTKAGNGVLIDGVGQLARSTAGGRITEFAVDGDTVTMAGDATDAYGGRATRAIRRITVTGNHTVTIEDDLEAPTPSTFDVLLHAPPTATVEVDGDALVVRGRRAWLRARVVEPSPMLLWTSGTVDVPPPAWLPQPADIHATFRTRVPTHRQRIVTVLDVHLPHRSG